jgi:hypothetical protein
MTLRGGSPGRVFLDSHHHHTLHLPPTMFTSLIRSRASYQLRVRSRELSDFVFFLCLPRSSSYNQFWSNVDVIARVVHARVATKRSMRVKLLSVGPHWRGGWAQCAADKHKGSLIRDRHRHPTPLPAILHRFPDLAGPNVDVIAPAVDALVAIKRGGCDPTAHIHLQVKYV